MQTVLRNPLAAPELTGVTPGAVLAVLAGMQLGLVPADSPAGALLAALAGALAFVGLVVPHVARALFGGDLRRTLPAVALLGGTTVAGADAVAQAVTMLLQSGPATQRLGVPAGAVTALAGAAALVVVARRSAHVEPT
ncbi:iron chelate uptake ABC transporter family permease subunit [Micromonospora sp. CPCC 206061]|uniref:iron chelate uptake ABC transporter family permease subunit n=1 Tax=Micromonospora sp. CPCC 206061 TaxID=3122410 RepID=UPI002FEE8B34